MTPHFAKCVSIASYGMAAGIIMRSNTTKSEHVYAASCVGVAIGVAISHAVFTISPVATAIGCLVVPIVSEITK